MTKFWLATFAIGPPPAAITSDVIPMFGRFVAIEVLNDGENWGVLFSKVDNPAVPSEMTCRIAFTNESKACNLWLDRGFPIVDATIQLHTNGKLGVVSPFFAEAQTAMLYDLELLAVSGLGLDQTQMLSDSDKLEDLTYAQCLQTPDVAQPDVFVTKLPIRWTPSRVKVRKLAESEVSKIDLHLGTSSSRFPSFTELAPRALKPVAAWTGEMLIPTKKQGKPGKKTERAPHAFAPAFRFEDVEILGFRINLEQLGHDVEKRLAALIEPLNFHLTKRARVGRQAAIPDFRYRAATSTLVIELLRYGRMKARGPTPPLTLDDSQSQHELLLRLLVGRVDDDTAQAHFPAVYAPAIFVDNPWSKILGRDSAGYDKRMADFCVDNGTRLLPDGRSALGVSGRPGESPVPLGKVARINLVQQAGIPSTVPLIDFKFASNDHTDPEAFLPIDLDLALGVSALTGARWRQSDFDLVEFRRSFAAEAIAESVTAFRSIQVAPVGDRGGLGQTWVIGTFTLDPDFRFALPSGVATLTLHAIRTEEKQPAAVPSAPSAWNLLCEMLGDGKDATVTLPSGSWYRLLCSMDLTVEDGLDWSTPGS